LIRLAVRSRSIRFPPCRIRGFANPAPPEEEEESEEELPLPRSSVRVVEGEPKRESAVALADEEGVEEEEVREEEEEEEEG